MCFQDITNLISHIKRSDEFKQAKDVIVSSSQSAAVLEDTMMEYVTTHITTTMFAFGALYIPLNKESKFVVAFELTTHILNELHELDENDDETGGAAEPDETGVSYI